MELLFNHQNTKTLHHKATIKIDSDINGQNNWLIIDWLLQIINCLQLHLKNFRSSKMGVWVQLPLLRAGAGAHMLPQCWRYFHWPLSARLTPPAMITVQRVRVTHAEQTTEFPAQILDTNMMIGLNTSHGKLLRPETKLNHQQHWLLLFDPVFLLVFVQYNDMSDSNG